DACDGLADLNGDGVVNFDDWLIFRACMGGGTPGVPIPGGCGQADINQDGRIDINDAHLLRANWESTTLPPLCIAFDALTVSNPSMGDVAPVQLAITDPLDRVISGFLRSIPGAVQFDQDLNGDHTTDVTVQLTGYTGGRYLVYVVPESWAAPTDQVSLRV